MEEFVEDINENCPNCLKQWNKKMKFCLNCDLPSSSWTTGNDEIDEKIKQVQLNAFLYTNTATWFEWIPFSEFSEIKFIAVGGFGSVSSAIWNSGRVCGFDEKRRKLIREESTVVALKTLFESDVVSSDIIQEVS
ncbi:4937_t:CDS:1 [Ambispora leptoticha]|uniref:4937_t:CDS:1 n=1 Tax=Ambispora leptoticha TaxID=144679 RepID=A0A9N9BHC2_9GLOM|nr:4937_t:CDS:1 [Ambispora leptoticha]